MPGDRGLPCEDTRARRLALIVSQQTNIQMNKVVGGSSYESSVKGFLT
jgi:hypothetical protein